MTPPLTEPPPAQISIGSTLAETGRLHDWLDGVLAALPPKTGHAMRLCLEEAVMNVILHGYGVGQPGVIEVSVWPALPHLAARVSDAAAEFDPTTKDTKPRRSSLDEGPLGGRGLGLIRRYATEIEYQRRDGRNHLTLGFTA